MSRGSHTTRVLLSSVLAGETAPEDIELEPMSWWRNQGVTLKVGCPATEIDVGRREIKIANDESVSFSRLVPAAGSAPLPLNVPAADLRANCSIPPISSQAQGAASLECPPTFSAPHRRGDRIGWLIPVMALKRPTAAPVEGLLIEAVLKHTCAALNRRP
jgi:NADPH-dependent 2,4-dienoyl-CoA reductase/sulfur reductase-like enzyme